jgi:hypothetical protein
MPGMRIARSPEDRCRIAVPRAISRCANRRCTYSIPIAKAANELTVATIRSNVRLRPRSVDKRAGGGLHSHFGIVHERGDGHVELALNGSILVDTAVHARRDKEFASAARKNAVGALAQLCDLGDGVFHVAVRKHIGRTVESKRGSFQPILDQLESRRLADDRTLTDQADK